MESGINGAIASQVGTTLANLGKELTPTAVVSALTPTVTGSGVAARLVLGDLFGPAIVPIPGNLAINITPRPRLAVSQTYLVTVTNAANSNPVQGAMVVLNNFNASGQSITTQGSTNAQGQWSFTAELRDRTEALGRPKDGGTGPLTITLPPTLFVSANMFNSNRLSLA
jgi:hypothetical protein